MAASAVLRVHGLLPSSEPDHEYWVFKPSSNLEQDLREALLLVEFGYTIEDVEALSKETGFKIVDTRTPNDRATPLQIQSWPKDAQLRVKITLSDAWVKRIETFKQERDAAEIRRAAQSISDPRVRAAFIEALLAIDTGSTDRSSKLIGLLNAISAYGGDGSVLQAIEVLDSGGRAQDPYLPLIRAHVALINYTSKSGPGYDSAVLGQLEELEERLVTARSGGSTSLESLDLEVINGQMSRIYEELGDEDESIRRAWIARFADMAANDTGQYRPGQMVQLIRPETYVMTRPRQSQLQLYELDADWAERQRMEQMIDNIGAPKPKNADRVDAFNGDLDEGARVRELRRNKNRGTLVQGGRVRTYRPKYKYVEARLPMRNAAAMSGIKGKAGALDLVMLGFKYAGAARRMRELGEYLAKRDAIVNKIDRENNRVVPPKPPGIRSQIEELLRLDRATRDPKRKQEIATALRILRGVLEESRAAWPGL